MLSGPANDYFGDTHHLRGGFPTPNESSLRTGLTPGGSGSMFPAPSPNSQAIFSQLASSAATPGTLDFQRTALSAAAAKREQQARTTQLSQSVTSQPQDVSSIVAAAKTEPKPPAGPFDPHDNDAANGLFMLAQGRNGAPVQAQFVPAAQPQLQAQTAPLAVQHPDVSPQMANGNVSVAGSSLPGGSEADSVMSDESEPARPNTRAKGKRNSAAAGTASGRRKADDAPAKGPAAKKSKTNGNNAMDALEFDHSDDDMKVGLDGTKTKMTDEEKRKNFLERNRVAALKCRQRKKQWLANLQTKVEMFSSENDSLTAQISSLREEVVNLKTLLLAHKDCPVTQQQGLQGAYLQQAMEPFNPQINPYGMAGIPNQPVMAGQGMQRRFS
jgi:ATF/CREB family transcription factor